MNEDTHSHKLSTQAEQLAFLFAGKSTFTVRNTETGNRFTFRVSVFGENNDLYGVRVLGDGDGSQAYTYMGTIFDKQTFRVTRKSQMWVESQAFRVFDWMFAKLLAGGLPECIEFWHEGYCGRCGGQLTTPESIQAGYGPVCLKKVRQLGSSSVLTTQLTWDLIARKEAADMAA